MAKTIKCWLGLHDWTPDSVWGDMVYCSKCRTQKFTWEFCR